MISHCLNKELVAYGLKTRISPYKTAVFIDDEGMCKVLDFFKGKGYHPVLTLEHTERIGTVIDDIILTNVQKLLRVCLVRLDSSVV